MIATVRPGCILAAFALAAAVAACGQATANAKGNAAHTEQACAVKTRSGTAALCLTRLDQKGWAFRLSGFQPRSTYRFRIPGLAFGFDTKVDSNGTTDRAGMQTALGIGSSELSQFVISRGFSITGKDEKGQRVRLVLPPR